MIPYLMKGRNESVVYYEQILDLAAAQPFIQKWNAAHDQKITPFHLVMAACAKALHARPGLNRFVSGGRIYQRNDCTISFAAKKQFSDDAPLVTVKVPFGGDEPLEETVRKIHASVGEGRSDKERAVDKEVKLALLLPGFLLKFVVGLLMFLDRWNLMPAFMIRNDPMYASLFCANLGSVGIDRVWHHLYEYGTVSLFCVIGESKPRVVPGPDGQPVLRDTLRLRFSFDERINDGFYCAASLAIVRDYVENPELFITQPVPPPERAKKPRTSTL
jgi:hypothetical protein